MLDTYIVVSFFAYLFLSLIWSRKNFLNLFVSMFWTTMAISTVVLIISRPDLLSALK